MKIIYEPKGRAREYAPLALNIYKGCSHGCLYCYAPGCVRKAPVEYFGDPDPKSGILAAVRADAMKMAGDQDDREVLLSFIGDPYQPIELELKLTREVIKILVHYGIRFTILTKGGSRAKWDFHLVAGYDKFRFGTSLVFDTESMIQKWEPGAASYLDRVSTISDAKRIWGIKTWVSLEPVMDFDSALNVILANYRYVDHWKVGKINGKYDNRYSPEDWAGFRVAVEAVLDRIQADYYIKDSLKNV